MKPMIDENAGRIPGDNAEAEKENRDLLETENKLLQEKLGWSAYSSVFAEDMDPENLNAFLRHIQFMEDIGPHRTIHSLFPPEFTFPPIDSMGEAELQEKLETIENILAENGILIELSPALPDPLVYKYIMEEMMGESVPANIPEGAAVHFTGCGGGCPDCFQREFCETKKELSEIIGSQLNIEKAEKSNP